MSHPSDVCRIAAIDVGSNSVKMLAADVSAAGILIPLARKSSTVRLQAGLSAGILHPDSLERAALAIQQMAEQARALGAKRVEAFGTSALREARNGSVLSEMVALRAGVRLRIISGEEEARSAYLGAAPAGRAVIVNPGGGSTELACGDGAQLIAARSAMIGAVSLKEIIPRPDMAESIRLAEETLRPEWLALGSRADDEAVASGGTATCAAAVLLGLREYDPQAVEGFALTKLAATDLMERLFAMPAEERCLLPGLPANRADILPYGLAILTAFLRISGRDVLRVTDKNNLYGFLRMMMEDTPCA